tara:strand:+ start:6828 stop:7694 length:867 start_codon:yes stop_codon:yes gene_type:complete
LKNRISIGTANFGTKYGFLQSKFNSNEFIKLKKLIVTNNLKKFDTSINYSNSLNNFKFNRINNLEITTKIHIKQYANVKPFEDVERQLIYLLKIFNTKNNKINVLVHNSKLLTTNYGYQFYKVLEFFKKIFPINKIGISCYFPEQYLSLYKKLNIEIIQFPLNIFDNRFVNTKMLQLYKKNNLTLQARSIFLQGVLLSDISLLPKYFKNWSNIFSKYEKYLEFNKISSLDACINHIKPFKQISSFIFGINNVKNLQEIVISINKKYKNISFNTRSFDNKLINPYLWKI